MSKPFDLGERTFKFASDVRRLVRDLPSSTINFEDEKQVVRSSGSVGANYIEANEAFSKKDRLHRFKICRKEAKETAYWLKLLRENNDSDVQSHFEILIKESTELKLIFNSFIKKIEND